LELVIFSPLQGSSEPFEFEFKVIRTRFELVTQKFDQVFSLFFLPLRPFFFQKKKNFFQFFSLFKFQKKKKKAGWTW